MNNNDKFDFNVFLKDAVTEMVNNPCEENYMPVIVELLMRVNDEGTVPTPFQNEMHVVFGFDTDIEIEDIFPEDMEMGNKVIVLYDKEFGYKWLPLYTGREEIQTDPESVTVRNMPIRELMEQVLDNEELMGIIINPDTDCLVVCRDALEFILDNADGEIRHAC